MRRLAPARITDPVCPDAAQPKSTSSTSALRRLRARAGASGRYLTGLVAFSALLCGGTHEALAQFGPGGGLRPLGGSSPGGFGGAQGNAPSDKPEGPAEAAPTTGPTDVATEPLPESTWAEIGLAQGQAFSEFSRQVTYGQRTADNRLAFGARGGYRFGGGCLRVEYKNENQFWGTGEPCPALPLPFPLPCRGSSRGGSLAPLPLSTSQAAAK